VVQKPSLAKTSKMTKQGGKDKTLERGGLER
jgi:colicin import membrane protein